MLTKLVENPKEALVAGEGCEQNEMIWEHWPDGFVFLELPCKHNQIDGLLVYGNEVHVDMSRNGQVMPVAEA